jgi:hypothetical protein
MDRKPLSGKPRGASLLLRLRRRIPRPLKFAREWYLRGRIEIVEAHVDELDRLQMAYPRNRSDALAKLARLRTNLFEVREGVRTFKPQPAAPTSMRAREGERRPIFGAFDPTLPVRPWSPDAGQHDEPSNVIDLSPWSRRA